MKIAFALAVVVAAITAAPALADAHSLQGYVWITDAPQPTHFITDTLSPGGGKAAHDVKLQPQSYTFITDTLAPGGSTANNPLTVSVGRNFAWADAGIGALATAGLLLVVLGGAVLIRQRMHSAV